MMNNLHPIRDYIVPGKRAHLVGIGGVSMCPLAEVLRGMGIQPAEMLACGGGGSSPLWRQMLADTYNCPVKTVKSKEGPALGVAILARHFSLPFYVCAPFSTIDMACPTGADIEIENRAADEVTEMWYKERMAPQGVKVYNPAFDVTPASLITAFVTERGVIRDPKDFEKYWEEKYHG